MTLDASRNHHSFPRPDLNALSQYREVVAQCAGAQGTGLLRSQILAVLDRIYLVDTEIITMLDGVSGTLRGVETEAYRKVMRELEREGRTAQENQALLSYQEQAMGELQGGIRTAGEYLAAFNRHLSSVLAADIMDTRDMAGHAESLLVGIAPLGEQSHSRSLAFLLEDLKGPLRVSDARSGYVEEITKLTSPVAFFCDNILDSSGPQIADEFQSRAAELISYLQTMRRQWRS